MVDLSISNGALLVRAIGLNKLWAFKSSITVPLQHVVEIRQDPEVTKGWRHGWRIPGTGIPGVITAGTYYKGGQRAFWDVHNPDRAVVIDLRDEPYNRLIVEVADPEAAIALAGIKSNCYLLNEDLDEEHG